MNTDDLLSAYEATTFCADVPGIGRLELRVGKPSPELDRLLEAANVDCWAYVTAFNPASRQLEPHQNAERHRRLLGQISGRGWTYYEGEGVPDQPGWDPEASVLILGISREEALLLGRDFGQIAIVSGMVGRAAELLLCGLS